MLSYYLLIYFILFIYFIFIYYYFIYFRIYFLLFLTNNQTWVSQKEPYYPPPVIYNYWLRIH